jgi:ParB family chromosome partitioning protein
MTEKAAVEQAEKGGGRPVLRRALGRGLESLLRPAGASGAVASVPAPGAGQASTTVAGSAGAAPGVAGTAGAASAAVSDPSVVPEVAVGSGEGRAVPGVIAELQAQAAKRHVDGHEVIDLELDRIDANPHQTRLFYNDGQDALHELAESIQVQGVMQPITVRPGKDGRYFLIAGERRMRASKIAKKTTIPAIVRTVSEQQAAEMTLIENLQREDLNCMEVARGYILLSKNFNLTQEQIGQRVGVARETVSNYMRLAKLPEGVQWYLGKGQLDFSQARILLSIEDPEVISKVAHMAANDNWSVEKLEHYVLFDPSMHGVKRNAPKAGGGARWVDPNVRAAQRDLERILGVRVRIRDRNGKGKITLEYSTLEDFDRVLGMLTGKK